MLRELLLSKVPMIQIMTSDTVNIIEVLEDIVGEGKVSYDDESDKAEYHVKFAEISEDYARKLYYAYMESDKTLILVNQDPVSVAIQGGELLPSKELVWDILVSTFDEEEVEAVFDLFNGLTIKQVTEVIRVSVQQGQGLSADRIMTARKMVVPHTRGLEWLSTEQDFYVPNKDLFKWAKVNHKYFFAETVHPDLIPRGLLLHGSAGTGKTSSAKYLANMWQVPLYRLNFGSVMGKWVGESEQGMMQALHQLDNDSPCVVLMDEIEKIFDQKDDSGVSTRMLAQLLWWLQEHKSRIISVMTSNDVSAIPLELFRAGRIDETFLLPPLEFTEAKHFAKAYMNHLGVKKTLNNLFYDIEQMEDRYRTQAEVIQLCKNSIKLNNLCLTP